MILIFIVRSCKTIRRSQNACLMKSIMLTSQSKISYRSQVPIRIQFTLHFELLIYYYCKIKVMDCIKQYPYSYLNIKRKQPGQSKDEQRTLKYTYKLPHKFDSFFWDFDDKILQNFAQYFHPLRAQQKRKFPGYLLSLFAYLFSYASGMELQIVFMLALSLNSHDSLSKWIAHVLLMNCLIGQTIKRFIFRKRPF